MMEAMSCSASFLVSSIRLEKERVVGMIAEFVSIWLPRDWSCSLFSKGIPVLFCILGSLHLFLFVDSDTYCFIFILTLLLTPSRDFSPRQQVLSVEILIYSQVMAHLRRFHYQSKGRCCSTPAVASLPDFSDSYFEEIKVSYYISVGIKY